MNQILYTGKKKGGPIAIKKVVIFFSIVMLVLGLAYIGQGSYALYQDYQKKAEEERIRKEEEAKKPDVSIEKREDSIYISIQFERGIQTLKFNWNGTEDKVVDMQGRTEIEAKLDLPVGNNVFYLTLVDTKGKEHKFNKEYMVEKGLPTIELSVIGVNIKITAKDTDDLAYLTYRWNNDPEEKVEADPENPMLIEKTIELKKGLNTLTIVAVDKQNNTQTKTKEIKGVTKPKVELYQDHDVILIKASDEEGIEKIEYVLNGQTYQVPGNGQKEVEHRQKLAEGENEIAVQVFNVSGVEASRSGNCTYRP